jgi:hypothetical protein
MSGEEGGPAFELAPLFQAVGDVLRQNQAALNQADAYNGDHGDHMVEVFEIAVQAAQEKQESGLSEAMRYAGALLEQQAGNGSAQTYARGLKQLAEQFQRYGVTLDDLVIYTRGALIETKDGQQNAAAEVQQAKSGDVLKALMAGLAGWGQAERGAPPSGSPLDMGALFEFGMAYLQAKQRGGSRLEVLADAAVSVSPLGSVPHRYQSGKLAVQAFLEAMKTL